MNYFKLGLASVTFRQKSPEEIVEIAKKNGVEYIEWGADVHVKSLDDALKVKALCDNGGITCCSYGSYYRVGCGDKNAWEDICKIAAALGCRSVRIWLGTKNSEDTAEEQYRAMLLELEDMCRVAQGYGLLVCPECHDNTFNNNTDAFLRLKNELKADNFKTYFQSRYFRMDYDSDRIERTFEHIENVHVSYRDQRREQRFKKKNRSYLKTLLEKLREKNFENIVMVEFTDFACERSFRRDIERLRQL